MTTGVHDVWRPRSEASDGQRRWLRAIVRYAAAALAVTVAVALGLVIVGRGPHGAPFVVLFVATMFAAWYGGPGPAAVAVVLSTLAVQHFSALSASGIQPGTRAEVYFFEASAVSALIVALRRARLRADRSAGRLELAEAQLRKENRAHRALSAASEVLVRARDEGRMLQDICGAVVDVAGYRMCWVGWAVQDARKSVRAAAHAGLEEDYLENVNVTWADEPRGRGPVGTAIRTGRVSVFSDVARDPAFEPWRADALLRGYASVVGIPLRLDSSVLGALAIYASEPNAFDADEMALLQDLASDLAFGIASLRARALADRASRAKDEFLRVVSHELRTPLTALLGWAQLLRAHPEDPARLARGLEAIARSARSEARLVDELLEISKVAAGERAVETLPVELGSIVQTCVDRGRGEAVAKGIGLRVTVARGCATRGDRADLERAVCHILSNALKFTPPGGGVHVELSREGDLLLLRVRDTGKGISRQDLPHVFDLFRPGDRSTTRREGGLGAGLFVARAIIEAHGGSVHAESEGIGRGATLVVKLPVRP